MIRYILKPQKNNYVKMITWCPECGARYWEAGEYFDGDANPQYDEDGRKTGSGEYVEEEFTGIIPE